MPFQGKENGQVIGDMTDDLVDDLMKLVGGKSNQLLLAGPAGVGKSTLAHSLYKRFNITHVNHERMRPDEDFSHPCTLHQFDPYGCFRDHISLKEQFVIDIAAGTVFREDKNNEATLNRMLDFKRDYDLTIVVLLADRTIVQEQYRNKGSLTNFNRAWGEWEAAYPWWQKCLDFEFPID